MKFTMDTYPEAIAEVISAKIVKMVLETIKEQDNTATLEDAKKVTEDFFVNRIISRIDTDRIFYLKLPSQLQKILPDEDDYRIVQGAFNDAYMLGYQAGLRDLQELERSIE